MRHNQQEDSVLSHSNAERLVPSGLRLFSRPERGVQPRAVDPSKRFTRDINDGNVSVQLAQWVMNAVDNNLSATAGDLYNPKLHTQLWAAINDEINLPECDIYR